MINSDFKHLLIARAMQLLEDKLNSLDSELQLLRESAESDTKSSMGDKYETGREMIMQERNKLEEQKSLLQKQQSFLSSIDSGKTYKKVEFGALVATSMANYMICIPLGLIEWEGEKVFFISANSPIGQVLLGRAEGERIEFNKQSIQIQHIT